MRNVACKGCDSHQKKKYLIKSIISVSAILMKISDAVVEQPGSRWLPPSKSYLKKSDISADYVFRLKSRDSQTEIMSSGGQEGDTGNPREKWIIWSAEAGIILLISARSGVCRLLSNRSIPAILFSSASFSSISLKFRC
jgi:hypothetical protein